MHGFLDVCHVTRLIIEYSIKSLTASEEIVNNMSIYSHVIKFFLTSRVLTGSIQ